MKTIQEVKDEVAKNNGFWCGWDDSDLTEIRKLRLVDELMTAYAYQFKFILEDHSPEGHNVTNLQYQKLRDDKQKLLELIGRMSEQIREFTAAGCTAKDNVA